MSVLLVALEGSSVGLVQALCAKGSLLACPEGSVLAQSVDSFVRLPNGNGRWLHTLRLAFILRKVLRERDIDVVHSLDARAALVVALLHRLCGVCTLHTVHELAGFERHAWRYKQASALVFTNHVAAGFVDPDRTSYKKVVPCCVQLGAYAQRRARAGRVVFVVVSDLAEGWDLDILLQAMAYLQNMAIDLPPWEVRIVGEGPRFEALLNTAENLGVHKRLSMLERGNKMTLLHDADVLLCVAPKDSSATILEGWATGLPVICPNLPEHMELAEDKVSALMVPVANPVALAGAMLRLMQEAELGQRLSEGGHKAVSRFECCAIAEQYLEIYSTI